MEKTNPSYLFKQLSKELINLQGQEKIMKLVNDGILTKTLMADPKFLENFKNIFKSKTNYTPSTYKIYITIYYIECILKNDNKMHKNEEINE